jgi:hypothetical protein
MTENTLCLNYKDQLSRKIEVLDSGSYIKKTFSRNVPIVLLSVQVVYIFPTVVSKQC